MKTEARGERFEGLHVVHIYPKQPNVIGLRWGRGGYQKNVVSRIKRELMAEDCGKGWGRSLPNYPFGFFVAGKSSGYLSLLCILLTSSLKTPVLGW